MCSFLAGGGTAWGFLAFLPFPKELDASSGSLSPVEHPEAQRREEGSRIWRTSEFHVLPLIQKRRNILRRRLKEGLRNGPRVLECGERSRDSKWSLIYVQGRWLPIQGSLWNFKSAILNMFKSLKETMSKEKYENNVSPNREYQQRDRHKKAPNRDSEVEKCNNVYKWKIH